MARTLRYSGLFVLAVTAWVMIAGHFAWITEEFADRTSDRLLPLGVILLVAGLLVPVLAPVLRTLAGTRCVR